MTTIGMLASFIRTFATIRYRLDGQQQPTAGKYTTSADHCSTIY
jgi:hypothetical protein